ncbi:MAG: hypothetical protein GXO31_07145 [Epsilonproteobacteria bacterium]|nr:hypothetical protein [Campylobacterota bacterium]
MKYWLQEIKEIEKDNINSATFITFKAIDLIEQMAQKESENDLKKAFALLKNSHPMMAVLYNFCLLGEDFLKKHSKDNLKYFCERFKKDFKKANETVIEKASKELRNIQTVLTHSFSSLVFQAILNSYETNKNIKVICTESRPKNEGVILAEKLKQKGIKTILITDASAPYFVKKCDKILIGADGVSKDYLVHKIGTLGIALAAKNFSKEIISLAPKIKFWPKNYKIPKEEPKNPKEVTDKNLNVVNLYFDQTPKDLISKFITD